MGDEDGRIEDSIAYLQSTGLLQGFQSVLEQLIATGAVRLDKTKANAKANAKTKSAAGTDDDDKSRVFDAKTADRQRILAAAEAVIAASSGAIGGSGSASDGVRAPLDVYEWAAKRLERFGAQYVAAHPPQPQSAPAPSTAKPKAAAAASPSRIPALAPKHTRGGSNVSS